jgi:hypothetical protein
MWPLRTPRDHGSPPFYEYFQSPSKEYWEQFEHKRPCKRCGRLEGDLLEVIQSFA